MALSRLALRTVASVSASAVVLAGIMTPTVSAQSSFGSSDLFSFGSSAPEAPTEPKNIIYMVGDGMGFNHVAATNLYETGQTKYRVEGEANVETLEELAGESVQTYEDFNRLSMTTFQHGGSYDPIQAWNDHNYVNTGSITDSAAAGTAMATGAKTANGTIGLDHEGNHVENTSERAIAVDKAAGVVSSVPFNHATPAAWAAHNANRNDYHGMANEMLNSDLDVIMGAGHPLYDDSNNLRAEPRYQYLSEEDFTAVSTGETDFTYVEDNADFEALANGDVEDTQYFGLAKVASTLQQGREGFSEAPYSVPSNDVVDLATMSEGALNILGQDEDGFHLMIEGGAIDWTGHANDISRNIEEQQDFNKAVDAVVDWVEQNSSWDETLLIVTADHETGYLSGQDELPNWKALTGEAGQVPDHGWYSGNHTNQVVPFFFKGAGSEDIKASVTGTDPIRGEFIDNVTVANLTFNEWWTRG
ncbi:Alkaline phosphatase 3 precursor [Corynebacterium faecale]|uniref:alkaline phosphatase n=1 Tax=Corynebacterium faecale TaxID=1758466 RepID=UPI0025B3C0DA|nr:alkaline phosphatase [Corynebacterium faecale]WJY91942.1 Alkaline phosphatase 3 precursor [Corynebacterium faecale]